jgi:hypothetical protein
MNLLIISKIFNLISDLMLYKTRSKMIDRWIFLKSALLINIHHYQGGI